MKKNRTIKYPFTIFMIIGLLFITLLIATWMYVDLLYQGVKIYINIAFGISLGIGCIIWFAIFIKFGGKYFKIELKQREKKFAEKVKLGKKIILAQKRTIIANFCVILAPVLLFTLLLITPWMLDELLIYFILIAVLLVALILGILFSFVFVDKYLIYDNFHLIIKGKEYQPNQIEKINKVYQHQNDRNPTVRALYFHIEFVLTNGEKILCPKADTALDLEKKINLIKQIVEVSSEFEIKKKGEENE